MGSTSVRKQMVRREIKTTTSAFWGRECWGGGIPSAMSLGPYAVSILPPRGTFLVITMIESATGM